MQFLNNISDRFIYVFVKLYLAQPELKAFVSRNDVDRIKAFDGVIAGCLIINFAYCRKRSENLTDCRMQQKLAELSTFLELFGRVDVSSRSTHQLDDI